MTSTGFNILELRSDCFHAERFETPEHLDRPQTEENLWRSCWAATGSGRVTHPDPVRVGPVGPGWSGSVRVDPGQSGSVRVGPGGSRSVRVGPVGLVRSGGSGSVRVGPVGLSRNQVDHQESWDDSRYFDLSCLQRFCCKTFHLVSSVTETFRGK